MLANKVHRYASPPHPESNLVSDLHRHPQAQLKSLLTFKLLHAAFARLTCKGVFRSQRSCTRPGRNACCIFHFPEAPAVHSTSL